MVLVVSVEALQRIFKTLNDGTRIRILGLLEQEELPVQDLVQILSLAQSTVSRHLSILREAGLLQDRKEGTWSYYRFVQPEEAGWAEAWELARRSLQDDPVAAADQRALRQIVRRRSVQTRAFFDALGPRWDSLREVFDDDVHRARAISRLVPRELRVADIGTGTGILARELLQSGLEVVAVDHSERMLDAARGKLDPDSQRRIEFRLGEATALPLEDASVDAALAHMVLHYIPTPGEAVREMARVVRPGGRVVLVDFLENDRDWMKEELGVVWQGFPLKRVRDWFPEDQFEDLQIEVNESSAGGDLPATFIASAQRVRT